MHTCYLSSASEKFIASEFRSLGEKLLEHYDAEKNVHTSISLWQPSAASASRTITKETTKKEERDKLKEKYGTLKTPIEDKIQDYLVERKNVRIYK